MFKINYPSAAGIDSFQRRINDLGLRYYLSITGLMCALSFFIFYPGMMANPDSMNQWQEGISGIFKESYPPLMAWWWGWLTRNIWYDQAVLLLCHLLIFWSGVYILGRTLGAKSSLLAYLSLGLWFIPPVMAMTAVLVKDTGLALSWFLACVLMTSHYQEKRRPGMVTALWIFLLLFYGTAIRQNAITALPPLCYWFALCLRPQGGWRRTLAVAILLFCGLFATREIFNTTVSTSHHDPKWATMINDLGSLSEQLHTPLIPSGVQAKFIAEFQPKGKWEAPETGDTQEAAALMHAYVSMIMEHPGAYLAHRWELFKYMATTGTCAPYWWQYTQDNANIRRWTVGYMDAAIGMGWYVGGVWLLIAMAMLLINVCHIRSGNPIMLQAGLLNVSALMYMLPYFIISPVCDFKYLYWTVIATALAALMSGSFFYSRRQAR